MKKERPDPEELLKRVQEEERQKNRGKLKIYLGAAPGVGKTYTMLQDAIQQRLGGLDVVAGVLESHGRREIEEMLAKIEILPRQIVEYRGKKLVEFDLNGALKRNPAIILIDEMAHTNAPGLLHAKRWQDIKEILHRGIDVYSTLNVQHIESLNDVVMQITQIKIKETVPDSIIELADTIELVDLSPEDLLRRLKEGKVYLPQRIEVAKQHYFRKGNLIALRELALRITAERVKSQALLYRQGEGIERIWHIKNKILVCVGSRPESAKVIRVARRMATSLQADWIAVHVDAARISLSEDAKNNAIANLRFAEKMGAETKILIGSDFVQEILSFAREQNVTQIMIWKQIQPRWKEFFFRSLADEIVRHSGDIDIYVVTGEMSEEPLRKIE